jgi:hypothetical protein
LEKCKRADDPGGEHGAHEAGRRTDEREQQFVASNPIGERPAVERKCDQFDRPGPHAHGHHEAGDGDGKAAEQPDGVPPRLAVAQHREPLSDLRLANGRRVSRGEPLAEHERRSAPVQLAQPPVDVGEQGGEGQAEDQDA